MLQNKTHLEYLFINTSQHLLHVNLLWSKPQSQVYDIGKKTRYVGRYKFKTEFTTKYMFSKLNPYRAVGGVSASTNLLHYKLVLPRSIKNKLPLILSQCNVPHDDTLMPVRARVTTIKSLKGRDVLCEHQVIPTVDIMYNAFMFR